MTVLRLDLNSIPSIVFNLPRAVASGAGVFKLGACFSLGRVWFLLRRGVMAPFLVRIARKFVNISTLKKLISEERFHIGFEI